MIGPYRQIRVNVYRGRRYLKTILRVPLKYKRVCGEWVRFNRETYPVESGRGGIWVIKV